MLTDTQRRPNRRDGKLTKRNEYAQKGIIEKYEEKLLRYCGPRSPEREWEMRGANKVMW